MDEGRRGVEQSIPFADRRADKTEPAILEVAKPTVNQPGGLPAGAAREVAAIQEAGPQPASSGLPRDTGSDDPTADHEDIEDALLHLREVGGSSSAGELIRQRDPSIRFHGFVTLSGSSSRSSLPEPADLKALDSMGIAEPPRPVKDVPSSRRSGPKALRTRRNMGLASVRDDTPRGNRRGPRTLQSLRDSGRDNRFSFRPRRLRRRGRRRISDPRRVRTRARGAVYTILPRVARQGRSGGPRDRGRDARAREIQRRPHRESPDAATRLEFGLRPEPLLHLVLRPRRDRGQIPGPALWEPQPAPDGGTGGGTELLLAPREGEAPGARADRQRAGHPRPVDRQAAAQGQEARARVLHRGNIQGVPGEVGGPPQAGRDHEGGPRGGPHREVHHRADLQLRFLLFSHRRGSREDRTPRSRLAVRDVPRRSRSPPGGPAARALGDGTDSGVRGRRPQQRDLARVEPEGRVRHGGEGPGPDAP